MCAIFGTNKYENFVKLYNENSIRGNFALGVAVLYRTKYGKISTAIYKSNRFDIIQSALEPHIVDSVYFLGHVQAPTSVEREFKYNTTHPFIQNNLVVAHNGVLTNFEQLKQTHNLHHHNNNVDSSIIPALIHIHKTAGKTVIESIENTFSELNGTFSTWIVDKETNSVYVCRLSSTVWVKNLEFSSIQVDNMSEMPEYTVFQLDIDQVGFKKVGSFKAYTHFFTF